MSGARHRKPWLHTQGKECLGSCQCLILNGMLGLSAETHVQGKCKRQEHGDVPELQERTASLTCSYLACGLTCVPLVKFSMERHGSSINEFSESRYSPPSAFISLPVFQDATCSNNIPMPNTLNHFFGVRRTKHDTVCYAINEHITPAGTATMMRCLPPPQAARSRGRS